MDEFAAYVYIVSSSSKCLYIGVTTALSQRIFDHKTKKYPTSLAARYNCNQLVYFERFDDIHRAVARETQLKKWSRIKKVKLIVMKNPDWQDLSVDWGKPAKQFDGHLRAPETMPW